jgi:hypothetical protein
MEEVVIFYGHFVYTMAIYYIFWSFGIFSPHFGMLYREKSGNPEVSRASKGKKDEF